MLFAIFPVDLYQKVTAMTSSTIFSNSVANISGRLVLGSDASISIFDRGFLYGDSIYEVTMAYQHHILFLQEHLERLCHSASLIGLNIPFDYSFWENEINKTLHYYDQEIQNQENHHQRRYIRLILTRGVSEIGLNPYLPSTPSYVIIVRELPEYPSSLYQQGVKLALTQTLRNDARALNPNIKSGNYLNNIIAMKEAIDAQFDDAIMLGTHGALTEGTTFNIWLINDKGTLRTPPFSSGLLKGITREKIIEIARNHKIISVDDQTPIFPDEIWTAQEVFLSSSTKGIVPVVQINHHHFQNSIGDHSRTTLLRKLYQEHIQEHISQKK